MRDGNDNMYIHEVTSERSRAEARKAKLVPFSAPERLDTSMSPVSSKNLESSEQFLTGSRYP